MKRVLVVVAVTLLIGSEIRLGRYANIALAVGPGKRAAIHDGNADPAMIHACVQKSNGSVRIVGISTACQNSETAMHWAGDQQRAGGRLVAHRTWSAYSFLPSGFGDYWFLLSGSEVQGTTQGGALLISPVITLTLDGEGTIAGACAPFIDGQWAGSYGGTPLSAWLEGAIEIPVPSTVLWSPTRVYPGVPEGLHVFDVRCFSSGNAGGLFVNYTGIPSSHLSIVELK